MGLFFLGFIVGGVVGVILMALVAARRDEDNADMEVVKDAETIIPATKEGDGE